MAPPSNRSGGLFFNLSPRAKIRVRGTDRLRFLNGQVTNDVRKATPANAIAACVLNAKGKLDAHVFLSIDSDSFVIDADPELRETLQPRLDRYIIADDVEIEDVSERSSIFHVLGAFSRDALTGYRTLSVTRFGETGIDIQVEKSKHEEVFRLLLGEIPFCDEACAEVFRIERGVPRWSRELMNAIIPVEANLEESCIDYEKGCYIGQEVISRMKISGQRNKKLCGLISLSGFQLRPETKLFSTGPDKKEIGWITSATHSERLGKQIALGYVKRGFNLTGNQLNAVAVENADRSSAMPVEIVDLPFVGSGAVSG